MTNEGTWVEILDLDSYEAIEKKVPMWGNTVVVNEGFPTILAKKLGVSCKSQLIK